jgi:hypothetical protein
LITDTGAKARTACRSWLDSADRRAVQDSQRREGKAQPDAVHPSDDHPRRRQAAVETNAKYNVVRNQQLQRRMARSRCCQASVSVVAADRRAVEVR